MGFYIIDDSEKERDDLYSYIKQHYPTMDDQSIDASLGKLQSMFDLDMQELINMLFEEREQLEPDDD